MAKKRHRKAGGSANLARPSSRRKSRLPVLVLTIVTAIAALAFLAAGLGNFASPVH